MPLPYPSNQARIIVRVLEARHLQGRKDRTTASPLCRLFIAPHLDTHFDVPPSSQPEAEGDSLAAHKSANRVMATSRVKDTLDPTWDESFELTVTNLATEDLVLEIFDNKPNKANLIGQSRVPLKRLKSSSVCGWFELYDRKDGHKRYGVRLRGSICVHIHIDTPGAYPEGLSESGLVSLYPPNHKLEPKGGLLDIFVGTWNVGNSRPPEDWSAWIPTSKYDIIAIGAQECHFPPSRDMSGRQRYASSGLEWFGDLNRYLGSRYMLVTSCSLREIRLGVWVHRSQAIHVSNVRQDTEATGIANIIGNKGATTISMSFRHTTLCFVNAHLAAHQDQTPARNSNTKDIVRGTRLGRQNVDIVNQFDYVFWFGDLNYRLDFGVQDKRTPTDVVFASMVRLIDEGRYDELLVHDQLQKQLRQKYILSGFQEGKITFPPTFKVERHFLRKYNPARSPAWCDRVLWYCAPGVKLTQLAYQSVERICTSDHKPVWAAFRLQSRYLEPGSRDGRMHPVIRIQSLRVVNLGKVMGRRALARAEEEDVLLSNMNANQALMQSVMPRDHPSNLVQRSIPFGPSGSGSASVPSAAPAAAAGVRYPQGATQGSGGGGGSNPQESSLFPASNSVRGRRRSVSHHGLTTEDASPEEGETTISVPIHSIVLQEGQQEFVESLKAQRSRRSSMVSNFATGNNSSSSSTSAAAGGDLMPPHPQVSPTRRHRRHPSGGGSSDFGLPPLGGLNRRRSTGPLPGNPVIPSAEEEAPLTPHPQHRPRRPPRPATVAMRSRRIHHRQSFSITSTADLLALSPSRAPPSSDSGEPPSPPAGPLPQLPKKHGSCMDARENPPPPPEALEEEEEASPTASSSGHTSPRKRLSPSPSPRNPSEFGLRISTSSPLGLSPRDDPCDSGEENEEPQRSRIGDSHPLRGKHSPLSQTLMNSTVQDEDSYSPRTAGFEDSTTPSGALPPPRRSRPPAPPLRPTSTTAVAADSTDSSTPSASLTPSPSQYGIFPFSSGIAPNANQATPIKASLTARRRRPSGGALSGDLEGLTPLHPDEALDSQISHPPQNLAHHSRRRSAFLASSTATPTLVPSTPAPSEQPAPAPTTVSKKGKGAFAKFFRKKGAAKEPAEEDEDPDLESVDLLYESDDGLDQKSMSKAAQRQAKKAARLEPIIKFRGRFLQSTVTTSKAKKGEAKGEWIWENHELPVVPLRVNNWRRLSQTRLAVKLYHQHSTNMMNKDSLGSGVIQLLAPDPDLDLAQGKSGSTESLKYSFTTQLTRNGLPVGTLLGTVSIEMFVTKARNYANVASATPSPANSALPPLISSPSSQRQSSRTTPLPPIRSLAPNVSSSSLTETRRPPPRPSPELLDPEEIPAPPSQSDSNDSSEESTDGEDVPENGRLASHRNSRGLPELPPPSRPPRPRSSAGPSRLYKDPFTSTSRHEALENASGSGAIEEYSEGEEEDETEEETEGETEDETEDEARPQLPPLLPPQGPPPSPPLPPQRQGPLSPGLQRPLPKAPHPSHRLKREGKYS